MKTIYENDFLEKAFNDHEPLIGILTGRRKDNTVTGNGQLFKELQKKMIENGGISVVFTPNGIKENSINGYLYCPANDKWHTVSSPLPQIVYNRVPFRRIEKSNSFQQAYQFFLDHQIPFFNASFIHKYEWYQLFSRDPFFKGYLPETIFAANQNELEKFLRKHGTLYLKPSLGSKGKGIYLLTSDKKGSIKMDGLIDQQYFKDFQTFWIKWGLDLMKKSYLAQEAIIPALYNGKRFDFRILVHSVGSDYEVTGIGIRQSKDQDITTHIPKGGVLIPYKLLQTNEHDLFFSEVANRAGQLLSREVGFFGEFSIDAGLNENGQYVIYEINSKPMQFDEEEIEQKRYQRLVELFFRLTGNH